MKRKAQTTLEVVILTIAVVSAGLAMQGYLRRAIQGNWRGNADSFSEEQYDRRSTQGTSITFRFPVLLRVRDIPGAINREYNLSIANTDPLRNTLQVADWGRYNDSRTHRE